MRQENIVLLSGDIVADGKDMTGNNNLMRPASWYKGLGGSRSFGVKKSELSIVSQNSNPPFAIINIPIA